VLQNEISKEEEKVPLRWSWWWGSEI